MRTWRWLLLVACICAPAFGSAARAEPPTWLSDRDLAGWDLKGWNDTSAYLTRSAIQPTSGYRRIWVRHENAAPEDWGVFGDNGRPLHVASLISLVEVDCAQARSRRLQVIYYSDASLMGQSTTRVTADGRWSYAAPGTFGEGEVQEACRNVSPRAPAKK